MRKMLMKLIPVALNIRLFKNHKKTANKFGKIAFFSLTEVYSSGFSIRGLKYIRRERYLREYRGKPVLAN